MLAFKKFFVLLANGGNARRVGISCVMMSKWNREGFFLAFYSCGKMCPTAGKAMAAAELC